MPALRHPQTYLERPADVREDPARHRALAVYYGPELSPVLARYRRVVVQPGHFWPERVERLQRRGVEVLAYLSLGEDDGGPAAWNTDDIHPEWRTRRVNVRHPQWREHIQAQVERHRPVFDGFLLDTLDSAATDPNQKRAMIKLVRLVRQWAGDRYLLANRGFDLLERLRGSVDGVLIESFSTTWQGGYHAYQGHELAYTEGLLDLTRRLKLDAFALDYADTPILKRFARRRANRLGVPTFITNRELTRL
ncbi:endo alpha-1,4 polygalactosaminidase [Deinococcus metalli]|nr:endo alpha-1,4 polygalactosaminidase [Deinococcus metalli]GHF36584.1 hypothetical protein GCM10017781_11550 [Deinococcus metalli]